MGKHKKKKGYLSVEEIGIELSKEKEVSIGLFEFGIT